MKSEPKRVNMAARHAQYVLSTGRSRAPNEEVLTPQTSFHCLLLVIAAFCRRRWLDDYIARIFNAYLSTVDELGQGDVSMMTENVDILEIAGGPIFELEAQEVTDIRWGPTTEFDGNCGSKVSCKEDKIEKSLCSIRTNNERKPANSGCSATIPVWWKNDTKGW
jgi:hypothetical protein